MLLHQEVNFPKNPIHELPARNKEGPYFELLENGKAITAGDNPVSWDLTPIPLYIACHTNCVAIAKRVMAAQEAEYQRTVEDSMRHLWRVFANLFDRVKEEYFPMPVCNIYSAQAYGDIWRFQEMNWEPGNDPKLRFESMVNLHLFFPPYKTDFCQHFEANPGDIPDMTMSIVSQLQTLSMAEGDSSRSGPSQLFPMRDLPSKCTVCTVQSSPSAWREALSQGYFSWLWDLDPRAIAQKEESKPPAQEWNWELLVRQLAQVNIHEPKAVLEDFSMGLRNRRRVWRIVEDILSEQVIECDAK